VLWEAVLSSMWGSLGDLIWVSFGFVLGLLWASFGFPFCIFKAFSP
jgi:hypothetical protein